MTIDKNATLSTTLNENYPMKTSAASVHHKWKVTRLLSRKGQYTSCLTSWTTEDLKPKK